MMGHGPDVKIDLLIIEENAGRSEKIERKRITGNHRKRRVSYD